MVTHRGLDRSELVELDERSHGRVDAVDVSGRKEIEKQAAGDRNPESRVGVRQSSGTPRSMLTCAIG